MSQTVRRTPRPSRRRAFLAALLAAVTLAGALGACTTGSDVTTRPKGQARVSAAPAPGTPAPSGAWAGQGEPVRTSESVLQIVAHPDDDLYFINPEVGQSLRSGRPLTTVYLTSGESDGVNAPRGERGGGGKAGAARQAASGPGEVPAGTPATADRAVYAESRQNGIRRAYAEMATGDRGTPWRRSVLRTAGGGRAELDTLQGHPHIRLVWSLVREAGSISAHRPHSLYGLWSGETETLDAQLTSAGPVTRGFRYTRAQLVDTLTGYLDRFRPTQVRTLDPTPGRLDGSGKFADHQDHFAGARFAQEAMAAYAAKGEGPHFGVETYLGYFNGGLPHVLDEDTAEHKLRALDTYAWRAPGAESCPHPAGCGDRKMIPREKHLGWSHGIRHTSGGSTSWLRTEDDGSLRAYAVLDGRIAVWHRPSGAASRWSGPELLPGEGTVAGLRPVRLPDGRTAVYGTRTLHGPGEYRKEIGYTVQQSPGSGRFGPWRSLGTPEPSDTAGLSDISAPAVTVDEDGAATVAVRTSRHELSVRVQSPDGDWAPWRGLGGTVHGDPAAATDGAGRDYLLASTGRTVLAWVRGGPGEPLSGPVATGMPAVAGPLVLRPDGNGDEGVRVAFRAPASGDARAALLRADDLLGNAAAGPDARVRPPRITDLGGAAGYGPLGVGELPDGGTLVAGRAASGDLATTVTGGAARSARDEAPQWSRTGFLFAGAPATAPLPEGGAAVTVLGLDGRLYWAGAGTGSGSGGWRPAAGPAPEAGR
ncbi:PIG-L family deacetylase [Streptomyces sp. HNM0574]|uniref:PIG-L family deacetylase n=1 Tax=Streptomyces sp. HNM0574 TaxID=2714954 RepID=UPI00146CDE1E|nr:PIG-L family deacetylase [Streptomyces sp. HNM0574]NLU68672.1 PIG-L family deacetylase [Streptomyces sp. HNM0574]